MDYVVRLTERALSPKRDALRVLEYSHSSKGTVVCLMRWVHSQVERRRTGSACIAVRRADGQSGSGAVPGRSGAALRVRRGIGGGESEPLRQEPEVRTERLAARGLEAESRSGDSEPRWRRSESLREFSGPSNASPCAHAPNPEPHDANLEA